MLKIPMQLLTRDLMNGQDDVVCSASKPQNLKSYTGWTPGSFNSYSNTRNISTEFTSTPNKSYSYQQADSGIIIINRRSQLVTKVPVVDPKMFYHIFSDWVECLELHSVHSLKLFLLSSRILVLYAVLC